MRSALDAGIEVRMITRDHAITASAIGAELGLRLGAASGADIQAMSDDELSPGAAEPASLRAGHAAGQPAAGTGRCRTPVTSS